MSSLLGHLSQWGGVSIENHGKGSRGLAKAVLRVAVAGSLVLGGLAAQAADFRQMVIDSTHAAFRDIPTQCAVRSVLTMDKEATAAYGSSERLVWSTEVRQWLFAQCAVNVGTEDLRVLLSTWKGRPQHLASFIARHEVAHLAQVTRISGERAAAIAPLERMSVAEQRETVEQEVSAAVNQQFFNPLRSDYFANAKRYQEVLSVYREGYADAAAVLYTAADLNGFRGSGGRPFGPDKEQAIARTAKGLAADVIALRDQTRGFARDDVSNFDEYGITDLTSHDTEGALRWLEEGHPGFRFSSLDDIDRIASEAAFRAVSFRYAQMGSTLGNHIGRALRFRSGPAQHGQVGEPTAVIASLNALLQFEPVVPRGVVADPDRPLFASAIDGQVLVSDGASEHVLSLDDFNARYVVPRVYQQRARSAGLPGADPDLPVSEELSDGMEP